ncbi:MAG: alanine racemase, partial [Desulfovibrionaceae bacterium]|nr:alanine racemase [Desulfovibrionaceae bacterium]
MTEMERFAAEHAPCYIYDKRTITKACRELRAAMPGVGFLYSIKSNPFAPVIRTAAGEGCGADAASSAEVLAALDAGIRPEDVFYSSPGKTDRDIAVAAGKCVVTADSLHELDRLNAHAAGTGRTLAVGLRVNPAFGMGGGAAGPSKFGVDEEQLPALFARVRDMQHVTVRGIHVHLRSQVLNAAALSGYYANCFALAERTAAEFGVRMDFINFGGGMGTVYDTVRDSPLDLAALSRTMADIGQRNRQGLGARLYMETGRYLTCRAGLFCTRA